MTQRPYTVLVAEDQPIVAQALASLLELEGYHVLTALDGTEAAAIVDSTPPDIVVTDVNMPGMDGLALCRLVKRLTGAPVVLISGRSAEELRLLSRSVGADAFMSKPIVGARLIETVASLLEAAKPDADGGPQ